MACVPCDSAPAPCSCSSSQTCVQTPRNCTSCPFNICIDQAALPQGPSASLGDNKPPKYSSGIGGTIGGAVGGILGGTALVLLGWWLWRKGVLERYLLNGDRHHANKRSSRHLRASSSQRRRSHQPPPEATTSAVAGGGEGSSKKRSSKHLIDVRLDDEQDEGRDRVGSGIGMAMLRRSGVDQTDDPFDDRHSSAPSVQHPSTSPVPGASSTSAHRVSSSLPYSRSSQAPRISAAAPDRASSGDLLGPEFAHLSSFDHAEATLPSAAYIPADSKSLSIADAERDGFGNPSASSSPKTPRPDLARSGSSGVKLPQLPAASRRTVSGPSRPPRAPGLDLKLPQPLEIQSPPLDQPEEESRFSASTVATLRLPRASDAPSVSSPPVPSIVSPAVSSSLFPPALASARSNGSTAERLLSPSLPSPRGPGGDKRASEAGSEVSSENGGHLSSILDPATIVTPISRDAAVRVKVPFTASPSSKTLAATAGSTDADGGDPFDDASAVGHDNRISASSLWSETTDQHAHLDPSSTLVPPRMTAGGGGSHDSLASEASFLLGGGGGIQFASRVQVPRPDAPSSSPSAPGPVLTRSPSGSRPIAPPSLKEKARERTDSTMFPSPPRGAGARIPIPPPHSPSRLADEEKENAAEGGGSPTPLPEPFKPFAGQKPSPYVAGSTTSPLGQASSLPPLLDGEARTLSVASMPSSRPPSSASSVGVRSGYGSVLEDIPFNIGIGGLANLGGGSFIAGGSSSEERGPASERGSVLSEAGEGGGQRRREERKGLSIVSTGGLDQDQTARFDDVPVEEMPRA